MNAYGWNSLLGDVCRSGVGFLVLLPMRSVGVYEMSPLARRSFSGYGVSVINLIFFLEIDRGGVSRICDPLKFTRL